MFAPTILPRGRAVDAGVSGGQATAPGVVRGDRCEESRGSVLLLTLDGAAAYRTLDGAAAYRRIIEEDNSSSTGSKPCTPAAKQQCVRFKNRCIY